MMMTEGLDCWTQQSNFESGLFQIFVLLTIPEAAKDTKIRPNEQKDDTGVFIFLQWPSINMVRLVIVHIPAGGQQVLVQGKIETLERQGKISQIITLNHTDGACQYQFKCKDKYLESVLNGLHSLGIGKSVGQIDVLPVLLSRPGLKFVDKKSDDVRSTKSLSVSSDVGTSKKRREYRMDDRMTIDEIGSFIDDGNHLTFNYMILLLCASLIAGTGLIGDSATTVIASMLVSPLMGPILSITFGLAVEEWSVIRRGLRNEVVGILISFLTGLTIGLISSGLYSPEYRSNEMVERGEVIGLAYGFVVAFASGIAVVVAITMGGVNAIVGTAISASLLPPVVNSGICLSLATIYWFMGWGSDARSYAQYSVVSFSLFLVNFVVIIAVGFVTFRYIKRVHPSSKYQDAQDTDLSSSGGSPLHNNCSIDSDTEPKRDKIEMKSVLH